jgi:membrane-anchored protein YejM (alkaline phosphatase superfamily)
LDEMKMKLRRVSVVGVALWHGLYSLIFAVLLGIFYAAYVYLTTGRAGGLVYVVSIPLLYCPLGFAAYALVAVVYNSVARSAGGITLELDGTDYDAPPPPEVGGR